VVSLLVEGVAGELGDLFGVVLAYGALIVALVASHLEVEMGEQALPQLLVESKDLELDGKYPPELPSPNP